MSNVLHERIEFPKWALIVWIGFFLVGGFFVGFNSANFPAAAEPHINTGGTAIANFGAAPINPQWLRLSHKSGQEIDSTPSHEWAVLTSDYEPHVERAESNGTVVWKITFP